MNLRRLEYFLTVVETGQVTAAANKLYIAQPALSRQLKKLERELELTLFERQGTGLVLTQEGRQLASIARKLVSEAKRAKLAVGALRIGEVSTLSVASTIASTRGFIAPFIASTSPTDPAVTVHVAGHFELIDLLDSGIDFLISPTAKAQYLETFDLVSYPIRAHVALGNPLAADGRTTIELAHLCAQPLIVPSTASVSRGIFDAAVTSQQHEVNVVTECDDGMVILALAASGHGVGVTTETDTFSTRSLQVLVHGKPLSVPLHAAWRPGHYASEAIYRLVTRLREFGQQDAHVLRDDYERFE